jgi:hypothetical protein
MDSAGMNFVCVNQNFMPHQNHSGALAMQEIQMVLLGLKTHSYVQHALLIITALEEWEPIQPLYVLI